MALRQRHAVGPGFHRCREAVLAAVRVLRVRRQGQAVDDIRDVIVVAFLDTEQAQDRPHRHLQRDLAHELALLDRQHVLGKIFQQRAEVVAETLRGLQHRIDVTALQHQPVPSPAVRVFLPDQPLAARAQARDLGARGALREVFQVEKRAVGTWVHEAG